MSRFHENMDSETWDNEGDNGDNVDNLESGKEAKRSISRMGWNTRAENMKQKRKSAKIL